MHSPKRYLATRRPIRGFAMRFLLPVLLTLISCDSSPSAIPTPTAVIPNIVLIATGAVPTPTVVPPTSTLLPPTATTATITSSSSAWSETIRWRDGDRYLLGANYPYYHYGNDFGGNAWGAYGVHDPATYKVVDADFAQMETMGINSIRWFAFADARAGITFDAAGMPTGIDEFVTQDFDAALEIAKRHNIGINFVLLDFRFMYDPETVNGVQLGGHAAVLASTAGQQALVQNVFEPLFKRYTKNPSILSWEVMNEPEWTLRDAGTVHKEVSQPLTLADFRAFAKLTVDAIHSDAGSYATIGCADMKWAQNWEGLDLDYYEIHFYDWMQPYSTDNLFATRAESLRLDRPVVVGEFPADHSTLVGLRDYLNNWYTNGYAGAWAWSFRADATWGGPDPEVVSSWADAHKPAVTIPPAQ